MKKVSKRGPQMEAGQEAGGAGCRCLFAPCLIRVQIELMAIPRRSTFKGRWIAAKRKLREYFQAGVRLVWYIKPKTRTARVYTAEHEWTEIGPNDSLSGGTVLPGFELPLAQLFARIEGPRKE